MSSSLPEKKFNIEKLNFNSIKSELSTIPKIVKKKIMRFDIYFKYKFCRNYDL